MYIYSLYYTSNMVAVIKVWLFVHRNLTDNELKKLPKGVFANNTQLRWL